MIRKWKNAFERVLGKIKREVSLTTIRKSQYNNKKKKTELKFLQIKQEITCGWNGYLGIWVFSPCMSSKLL